MHMQHIIIALLFLPCTLEVFKTAFTLLIPYRNYSHELTTTSWYDSI